MECEVASVGLLFQSDQASLRRDEAATLEVEIPEVSVEVDMEPFAVGRSCARNGLLDQAFADPVSAQRGCNHGVEQESVDATIPCHVDEADQS